MILVTRDPAQVANQLEALNTTTNSGRGSSVCRSVVAALRRNDVAGAIAIASLDYDKVRQYPDMATLFKQVGLLADRSMAV